jgi:hypothetical protein
MRRPLAAAVAGAIALSAAAVGFAAQAAPPVLKMPGRPDAPISRESLLGNDERDVRMEDVQGNVTIYHGQPLLEVLEKGGLEVKTMAGERKSAAAAVVVKARDGYTVAFSVGELRNARSNPKVFLVSEAGMDPLPENEGPVRLIVYGDPVRSSYALATIELRYLAENKK